MIKSAAVELQNAESGGFCLLDFLEAGSKILLSAALLAEQRREHLVGRHLHLSEWGLLELAWKDASDLKLKILKSFYKKEDTVRCQRLILE